MKKQSFFLLLFIISITISAAAQNPVKFFSKELKYGYKDVNGKIIIPAIYGRAENFSEGLACVNMDPPFGAGGGKGYGYIDINGTLVIPFMFQSADDFSCSRAAVRFQGKYGYINKLGKIVIPCMYGWTKPFKEGLAAVTMDNYFDNGFHGKWGYIDTSGTLKIAVQYDDTRYFSEGLAGVGMAGGNPAVTKWGFIDKTGKLVIPFQFDDITRDFTDGRAKVKTGDDRIYIDKTGKRAY